MKKSLKLLVFAGMVGLLALTSCGTSPAYSETANYPVSTEQPAELDAAVSTNNDEYETAYPADYTIDEETPYDHTLRLQALFDERACKETILASIEYLTEEPRFRGTAGETRAVAFIERQLLGFGYEPVVQAFDWYRHSMTRHLEAGFWDLNPYGDTYPLGTSYNIIADIPSFYENSRTLILIAHHDTMADCIGVINNATGVAALLEIARLVHGYEFPFNIRFIFSGAEMLRFNGSRYYVANISPAEREEIMAVINIDMIGSRDFGELLFCTPSNTDNILTLAFREIFPDKIVNLGVRNASDDVPFSMVGIPTIMLHHTQFEVWHGCRRGEDCGTDLDIGHIQYVVEMLVRFLASYNNALVEELLGRAYNAVFGFGDTAENRNPAGRGPANAYDVNILGAAIQGFRLIDYYSVLDASGLFSTIVAVYGNDEMETYTVSLVSPFLFFDEYTGHEEKTVVSDPDRPHMRLYFYTEGAVNNLDIVRGFVVNISSEHLNKDGLMEVYRRSMQFP